MECNHGIHPPLDRRKKDHDHKSLTTIAAITYQNRKWGKSCMMSPYKVGG